MALGIAILLAACSGQQRVEPTAAPATTSERPEIGAQSWLETDAVVAIDNRLLGTHLRSTLMRLSPIEQLEFLNIEFEFSGQTIGMTIHAGITQSDNQVQTARIIGDIKLSYSGAGLSWFPLVHSIEPQTPGTEWEDADWIQRINSRLIREVGLARNGRMGFAIAPPQMLVLSASLPDLGNVATERRLRLQGAYTVAASRVRIEDRSTTFALDLEFVDGISHCEADFSISRSTFSRRIDNREPTGVEPWFNEGLQELHYFTEVVEARRNLNLVHYWFADGRAIGITELAVEPSARWRTWSSLPISPGFARHIEVFVADQDSGCIVDAGHLELAGGSSGEIEPRETFREITRSFSVAGDRPRTAVVELSRALIAESLNKAAARTRFALTLEVGEIPEQPIDGILGSLAGTEFNCQWRDCSVRTACSVDFSRCQRRQDNRDCTTCLFRNPLNDRCISQRVDADCEVQKTNLNASYAVAWEACMAREEAARRTCELRGQEALEDCEQKAEQYQTTCEANREALNLNQGPVASLQGQSSVSGEFTLVYSDLQADSQFERMKSFLLIEPDLSISGHLLARPAQEPGTLVQCLTNWDSDFLVRTERPQVPRRLVGAIQGDENELSVAWPGVTVPLNVDKGLLTAIFEADPERFEHCSPGLNPAQLDARVSSDDGYLLRGVLPVDIQPGPTRIELPSIVARLNDRNYSATVNSRQRHFKYEFREAAD
jgi:hypothetical protein